MSWTGGTTAPFSSSSSESSLGLLTALVSTALLSTGPLPSTASSGAPPVMILTASSTAIGMDKRQGWVLAGTKRTGLGARSDAAVEEGSARSLAYQQASLSDCYHTRCVKTKTDQTVRTTARTPWHSIRMCPHHRRLSLLQVSPHFCRLDNWL